MKRTVKSAWLAGLLVVSGNVFASSAWWMLCDWCVTDSDFQNQALSAPDTYSPVYVSNRETNETRKYDRTFIIDDLEGGIRQTAVVTTARFPDTEKAVFEQAIENANIAFWGVSRPDLVGYVPGLGDAGSVAGDISDGFIRNRLISALSTYIRSNGLVPTVESVNRQGGLNIRGAGLTLGTGKTIRVGDLTIAITYEDGSMITVTRRGSDGKFVNWEVTDAEGSVIPVTDPESGTAINPASFADREFYFGGSPEGVLGLLDFIRGTTNLVCSAEAITANGLDVIRVICHRA